MNLLVDFCVLSTFWAWNCFVWFLSFNKNSTRRIQTNFDHGAYPSAWQAALPVGSSSDWSGLNARGYNLGFLGFQSNFVWRTWDVANWSVILEQGSVRTIDWAQKIWKKSTQFLQTQKLRSHHRCLNLRKLYRTWLCCFGCKQAASRLLDNLNRNFHFMSHKSHFLFMDKICCEITKILHCTL